MWRGAEGEGNAWVRDYDGAMMGGLRVRSERCMALVG